MHAGATPGNPMAEALHTSELLDVDVQEIAGMGMFIAGDHQRRLQPAATRETRALQNAGDRRGTERQRAANLRARPLLTPEDLGRELQRRGRLPGALMRSTRAIV